MTVKASTVVFSHLSDIQMEVNMVLPEHSIVHKSEFIKFIIFHVNDDLSVEIDPDALWEDYLAKREEAKKG